MLWHTSKPYYFQLECPISQESEYLIDEVCSDQPVVNQMEFASLFVTVGSERNNWLIWDLHDSLLSSWRSTGNTMSWYLQSLGGSNSYEDCEQSLQDLCTSIDSMGNEAKNDVFLSQLLPVWLMRTILCLILTFRGGDEGNSNYWQEDTVCEIEYLLTSP